METLNQFLSWLHDEGKDKKTITAYKATINQFINWYINTEGHIKFEEIKPIVIKEFLGYMKHTLNRKQATINKTVASLKTFFSFLLSNGDISDNPMLRIKIQKVIATEKLGEKDTTKWLTKEEQDRFISYVELEKNDFKRIRNLAIIDVMLYSGLRVGEVEELKLDDIRVNGDITLTIREGKHGKYASVVLVNKYTKNLRKWLRFRQSLTKEIHSESPYPFVSERSPQLQSRGIQVMLDKYAKLANMENITPHRFRHSFCKNLTNAGTPIQTVSKLARHESIQTTAIYIDSSYQEQIEALNKM